MAIEAEDIPSLIAFVERERIDLTVVGPEAPLVAGLADQLRDRGFAVFGPGADGARLEGSKAFAKQVMEAAGVPTGHAAVFTDHESALAFLSTHGAPVVVKADGLAAGKGVIVAHTIEEAEAALDECFVERRFGDAARTVLVEEFLEGEEVSLLSIVSGRHILPLAPAQDYKRALDGDAGPNTGGMGSYSPVPIVDDDLYERLLETVVRPTVEELDRRDIDFRGVLYAGVMLTPSGPKVLEFNCRFGDPETQALLPRLRSDLFECLWAAAQGEALPPAVEWGEGAAVGVVLASRGYPASSSKGDVISGSGARAVPARGRGIPRGNEEAGRRSRHQRREGADGDRSGRHLRRGPRSRLRRGGGHRLPRRPASFRHRSQGRRVGTGTDEKGRRMSETTEQPLIGILMGSQSDAEVMDAAVKELEARGITHEVNVLSAHRDPEAVREYSLGAEAPGTEGHHRRSGEGRGAAGRGGVDDRTPVIGVPIHTSDLGGLDSLLSMVQMPPGVPVATVAINGARNAAILAAKILRVGGL